MATPPEENQPEPVENDDTTDDATTAETAPETDAGAGDAVKTPETPPTPEGIDWKSMARKWEKRAKDNADARRRLDEATTADKTELELLRESIAALQTENESNKLRALRADVASKTGVPVELLSATTEEDLAEQAEAILGFVTAKTAATAPATRPAPSTENGHKPKEKLRSGAVSAKNELSRDDILSAVLGKGRRRNAGGN